MNTVSMQLYLSPEEAEEPKKLLDSFGVRLIEGVTRAQLYLPWAGFREWASPYLSVPAFQS